MSLRLEMLQVARLAPTVLGDQATALIRDFVLSQLHPSGLFQNRGGDPDLYYTSFAADTLTALQIPLPNKTLTAIQERTAGVSPASRSEDFVHLCCLTRLLSSLPEPPPPNDLLTAIESYRTPDGGYNQRAGAKTGSAYAALLAYGAYADHNQLPPGPDPLLASIDALRCSDGGYANDLDLPIGGTPPTAAAVTLLRNFQRPIPETVEPFFYSCFHESGGFKAFHDAPMPDLLSTAVTLHALDGLQSDFAKLRDPILDYIDTLWTADGGFHGNWSDHTLDIEYTYYGLLALGHLAT